MAYGDIVSAHGGWIVLEYPATDYTILDNTSYDYSVQTTDADVTTSGSAGWSENMTKLKQVASITVSCPFDSVADIEVIGIPLGAAVTLHCKKGENAKYDIFTGTHFQGVQQTINNADGEPIRRVYTFTRGRLASNQNVVAGVTTYLTSIDR